MSSFLKHNFITILMFCAIIFGLTAGVIIINIAHNKEVVKIKQTVRERVASKDLEHEKRDIEFVFNEMYQTLRTISMLPSVRGIKGGNRSSEAEDVVKEGRFSQDAHVTVQQLYNNLASNISVSEVYAILEGLDYKNGEVPFFMYDTLAFAGSQSGENETSSASYDSPEESEEAEYEYYPVQIAHFKKNYPRFTFSNIDEVPAVFSPAMRTCDNTQYLSQKSGDVKDAYGILYSVPFYNNIGELRGIISAIVRVNALEAHLMDVPLLIITDSDKKAAEKLGFSMPRKFSNLVLFNDKYKVYIYDRRNTEVVDKVKKGLQNKDQDVVSAALDVHGDVKWQIAYYIDEAEFAEALRDENRMYSGKLWSLAILGTLLLLFILFSMYKKHQNRIRIINFAMIVKDIAQGEGDLTKRVDVERIEGDIQEVGRQFNLFLDKLHVLVNGIKSASDQITSTSEELSSSVTQIRGNVTEQTDRATQVATASTQMTQTVSDIARNASNIADSSAETSKIAKDGAAVVAKTVHEVQEIARTTSESAKIISSLGDRSKQIGEIINVIKEIADQTQLLSLNAAIEAARAGEQGRGFAVVADEVSKLSEKTSKATVEIANMIEAIQNETAMSVKAMQDSSQRVEVGADLAQQAGNALQNIVSSVNDLQSLVQQIAAATDEMSAVSEQVGKDMEFIVDVSNTTKKTSGRIAEESATLVNVSETLGGVVGKFKL